MNGLGPDSYIDPQPFQHGQRFNIDGIEYTLILDKKHEDAPNIQGYKRILTIEEKEQRKKYVMYNEGVVYDQTDPSIEGPGDALNLDQINQLSKTLKTDFKKWQKTRGNG